MGHIKSPWIFYNARHIALPREQTLPKRIIARHRKGRIDRIIIIARKYALRHGHMVALF